MDIRNYFKTDTNNLDEESNNKLVLYEKSLKVYEVFTDGSSLNNGIKSKLQFGGIGVFFNKNEFGPICQPLTGKITNNIAELKACISAIEFLIRHKDFNDNHIHIYTDSEYTINCILKWGKKWEQNGWKNSKKQEISNKDLIVKLYNYNKKYKLKFIHVKSHQPEPKNKDSIEYKIWYGNFVADKLAQTASYDSIKLKASR
jgi:ribonuclease HI